MLQTCGLSIAMGNAKDEVKKEADLIIGNVYSSSFGEALDEFFSLDE